MVKVADRTLRAAACVAAFMVAGCTQSETVTPATVRTSVNARASETAGTSASATSAAGASVPADPDPLAVQPSTPTVGSGGPVGTGAAEAGSRSGRASGEQAVIELLRAEQALDHEESFQLLSSVGLKAYPSLAVWTRRRSDVARITGFVREVVKGSDVVVMVEHTPGINPFVGLRFARERQTWHTRQQSGGWLVDPDPQVEPVVPSDAGVAAVATGWVSARQACDDVAALERQAAETLLAVSAGAAELCGASGGRASVGPPSVAEPGPQTAALVAQYGADVLKYVRIVRVSGLTKPFTLFLVPFGDSWRVLSTGI